MNLNRTIGQVASALAVAMVVSTTPFAQVTQTELLPSEYADPSGYFVDSKSIMEAARVDLRSTHSGSLNECMKGESTAAPAVPQEEPARKPGSRLGGLLAGLAVGGTPRPTDTAGAASDPADALRERLKAISDPKKLAEMQKCAEDSRSASTPANGLAAYRMLGGNVAGMVHAASKASGVTPGGRPFAGASRTCVWSVRAGKGAAGESNWQPYPGIMSPAALPDVEGKEVSYTVVDSECYARKYPDKPLPASVEILTVHRYFDRVMQSRSTRIREAGYVDYASKIIDEYGKVSGRSLK